MTTSSPGALAPQRRITVDGLSSWHLLELWRGGDRKAGDELVRRYFVPLRGFFYSYVPEQMVDDLLQEVLTRLLTAVPKYRGSSSFRAYVFGIARTVRNQHYLHHSRRAAHTELRDVHEDELTAPGENPEQRLADHEHRDRFVWAMLNLPDEARQMLELYYFHHMTKPELAELFEISPSAVNVQLRRARKELREAFDQRSDTLSDLDLNEELEALGRRLG